MPLFLILAALAALTRAAEQQLSVNFSSPLVANFSGVSAVRHGFDYMPEEVGRGLTPSLRNVSYARLATSRLFYACTWYASEWAMPDCP